MLPGISQRFFNPTKLLGFICPIKNIWLILGCPSFLGYQKKIYQIYRVNLFPGNKFFKIDLIKIFWAVVL